MAALLLVSSCGGTGSGSGRTNTTTNEATSSGATTSPNTSESAGTGSPLADLDPCQLMTASEATELGISDPGKPGSTAGSPECNWRVSGQFGVVISLSPDKGVDSFNYHGKTPSSINVGKHPATKVEDSLQGTRVNTGLCNVFIAVSDSSAVQVIVTNSGATDTALACERAETVAEFADAKLP
ncbi:DUF3558 domain-containing protein [Goodfellowiella coeruleoviolacea]|uniref:DUF3558 domain-containing protein n=1 Tax=Goodfellowiella coeruleoviolacea TaxID=334858 RepID=UPI0020A2B1B4|nr:DUF3558 domain-containing protein [Goodfellowiella coeruleoviolacea]